MSERTATTKQIVDYWKTLGQQLSEGELRAYSDNGPVRGILRDLLKDGAGFPQEAVEIGVLFNPLCIEMGGFSRALLIDPIYAEKNPPRLGSSIATSSTPLPEALGEIERWLQGQGILVLEGKAQEANAIRAQLGLGQGQKMGRNAK